MECKWQLFIWKSLSGRRRNVYPVRSFPGVTNVWGPAVFCFINTPKFHSLAQPMGKRGKVGERTTKSIWLPSLTLRVWQTSVHQATFCSATGHLKLSNIREVERTRQALDCKHCHRLGELEVAVTSSSNGWRGNDTCLWGSGFSTSSNVTVWGATGGPCIVAF